MSESLKPQLSSFDPLAQARLDADPQRQLYAQWVDVIDNPENPTGMVIPEDAGRLVEFLESRPYQDEKGRVHSADGKFLPVNKISAESPFSGYSLDSTMGADGKTETSIGRQGDDYHLTRGKITRGKNGLTKTEITVNMPEFTEPSYEEMTMVQLARKLGEAERNEDRGTATEVSAVLIDKIDEFAKKTKLSPEGEEALFDRLWRIKDTPDLLDKGSEADKVELTTEQEAVKALGIELEDLIDKGLTPEEIKEKLQAYSAAYLGTIPKDASQEVLAKEYEQLTANLQKLAGRYNEAYAAKNAEPITLRQANDKYWEAAKRFDEAGDDEEARKKAIQDARVATNQIGILKGWDDPEIDRQNKRFEKRFGEQLKGTADNPIYADGVNKEGDVPADSSDKSSDNTKNDGAPEADAAATPEEAEANFNKELDDIRAQIRQANARGATKEELAELHAKQGEVIRNRGAALGEGHEPDSDWSKQQVDRQGELLAQEEQAAYDAERREYLAARQQKRSKVGKVVGGLLLLATSFILGDKYGARHHGPTLKERVEAIHPSTTSSSTSTTRAPGATPPTAPGTTVSTLKPGAPDVLIGLPQDKFISDYAADALHASGNHNPSLEQVNAETAHWLFDKDGKPISLEEAKHLPVGFKFGRK